MTYPHGLCRYTLGGFYLARYSDSPVGAFDEVCGAAARPDCHRSRYLAVAIHSEACSSWMQLVAVAGLVWNFPGSCAWAARVYVNDKCAAAAQMTVVLCCTPRSLQMQPITTADETCPLLAQDGQEPWAADGGAAIAASGIRIRPAGDMAWPPQLVAARWWVCAAHASIPSAAHMIHNVRSLARTLGFGPLGARASNRGHSSIRLLQMYSSRAPP